MERSSLDIEAARSAAETIGARVHPHCVACGSSNAAGLGLAFEVSADGSVSGRFTLGRRYESYRGIVHGGILTTILDDSMTHCLFAQGWVAVTADIRVQFRHPVATAQEATVRAWITESRRPVHTMKAEIMQAGQVKTIATGRFMEQGERLNKASDTLEETTRSAR